MPKQDFYNAGEKLNSMISIITTLALIVTGFIMWFPGAFSQGVIQWAMPIHAIAFGVAAAVIVAHIFLSIGHPNSKISIRGMIKGDVPVRYAKEHHEKWYDELVENGVVRETKKQDKGA
ncbi:MAG: cytochrome b/b6 domain-containing protein [Bacillus sp. (in: Bacteria)]|nr:cytochrome b/b6 domain-containing protein [Bacillus sp. (in: firmicutes)]